MTIDELSAPLGQHRLPQRGARIPADATMGAAVLAAALAPWALTAPTGQVAAPARAVEQHSAPPAAVEPVAAPAPAPAPAMRTVTIIDGTSGKRREIVIPETSNVIGFDQQSAR